MGYKKYTNLKNAAEIMEKIKEFALEEGWVILSDNIPDLAIDDSGEEDGTRLALKSPDGKLFATFRSANGKKIFNTQRNEANAYGIGLTCHDGYTQNPASGKWYDQPNAPVVYDTDEVVGVGIPIIPASGLNSYTVCINIISDPAHMLVVSVESWGGLWHHLACGLAEKAGDWEGGILFSGSRNSYNMFAQDGSVIKMETESLPLFSMANEANTFLRCDIDGAPTRLPAVLWANSGNPSTSVNHAWTGKQLALPVKKLDIASAAWTPKVPDYVYLQSQTPTDPGRNVNTLNCISVNEPQTLYVQRDPDELRNFSPAGYVTGLYFISMRNVAPGQLYHINYPESGNLHQVFPYTKRRGIYGYDGFSVKQ